MDDRAIVTAVIMDWSYSDEAMPLDEFIAFLKGEFDKIPKDRRSTAVAAYERGFGDEVGTFRVSYSRPETDAEVAARRAQVDRYKGESEALERRAYERLKAKFG